MPRIGIIGDFDPEFPPHAQTNVAIEHAAARLGCELQTEWLPTPEPHDFASYAGLWCAPGSPYRSLAGALAGVRFAREHNVPFLGTCGGFQHAVLEYTRNVMGIEDASHAEYDPYASVLFITPLNCSLAGKTMSLRTAPGSRAAGAYGQTEVEERYYCNFGLNPAWQERLEAAGLRITGSDSTGEARMVELPNHAFYVATLFVPQARSTRATPHPLILAFVQAAIAGVAAHHGQ